MKQLSIDLIRRMIGYFIYTLVLIYLLIKGSLFLQHLQILTVRSGISPFANLTFMVFLPVLVGVLLAMPQFIYQIKKDGIWRYDWVKFISIGLPMFYVTIMPLIHFTPVGRFLPFSNLLLVYPLIHHVCGVVFGFLILKASSKIETG